MSNTIISFYPTLKLVDPALPPDELYDISVTLTAFDQSDETSTSQIKSKAGVLSSSFYYDTSNFSCSTAVSDENGEPSTALYEMFFASTMNAEPFYMLNLDDSDSEIYVQMSSRRSRSRRADVDVGKFTYSFSVREVI